MNLSIEQKQKLKDYLFQVMKYRETYEEVYDHMLLTIENIHDQENFEDIVSTIIASDFGGDNGLLELEENCRLIVEQTSKSQFRANFKSWFTSPLLLVTAALFVGLFYMQLPQVETRGALLLLFVLLLVLPIIVCSVRGFGVGYKYGSSKKSIRDDIFRKIAFTANRNLLIVLVLIKIEDLIQQYVFQMYWPTEQSISLNVIYGIVTGVLVLMTINALSVIKLYRSEFKLNMLVN